MKAYLVIGVPGSGKSWVCHKLRDKFDYVPHDEFIGGNYIPEILRRAKTATKPLLIETPFSISTIKDPLEVRGLKIDPVFVIEDEGNLKKRWDRRGIKAQTATGHLTRQRTYLERAKLWHSFTGTSDEVLKYLQSV